MTTGNAWTGDAFLLEVHHRSDSSRVGPVSTPSPVPSILYVYDGEPPSHLPSPVNEVTGGEDFPQSGPGPEAWQVPLPFCMVSFSVNVSSGCGDGGVGAGGGVTWALRRVSVLHSLGAETLSSLGTMSPTSTSDHRHLQRWSQTGKQTDIHP